MACGKVRGIALALSVLLTGLCGCAPAQQDTEPAQNISENYQTRVDFGAKFEPKGNYILHGSEAQNETDFQGYMQIMGENWAPMSTMAYLSPHQDYSNMRDLIAAKAERYSDYGYLFIQMGVHFNEDENPSKVYYEQVANGEKDEDLKELIGIFKSFDRPVYCRPGFEFNGEWNGYTDPEIYKRAFIRFAELVKECDANNIALLWCYNPDAKKRDYMQYYPGDEYVDWWAIDIFRVGSMDMPNTKSFLEEAQFHEKPVMITEATPFGYDVTQGEGWEEWFEPFFRFVQENSVIKGVFYINRNWREYPKWKDWGNARLELAPTDFVQKYQQELSDPIYLHAKDRQSALDAIYDGETLSERVKHVS